MANLTDIVVSAFNFSSNNISSGQNICELNQITMLNQLQKMPKFLFMFICLAIFALIMQLYIVPLLRRGKIQEQLGNALLWFVLGSMFWAWLFDLVLTFSFPSKTYEIAGYVLGIISVIIGILYIIRNIKDRKKEKLGLVVGGLSERKENGVDSPLQHSDKKTELAEIVPVVHVGSFTGSFTPLPLDDKPPTNNNDIISVPVPPPELMIKKPDIVPIVVFDHAPEVNDNIIPSAPVDGTPARCLRCRTQRPMIGAVVVRIDTKNGKGRWLARSKCEVCGTPLIRMLPRPV